VSIRIPSTSRNQKNNQIVCMVKQVQVEYLGWAQSQVLTEEHQAISIKMHHQETAAVMELEAVGCQNQVVPMLMEVINTVVEVLEEVSAVESVEVWVVLAEEESHLTHTTSYRQLANTIIKRIAKELKDQSAPVEVE